MNIVNRSTKCTGAVTRKNTKNETEQSAIDFIAASTNAEQWIEKMIDEKEIAKIK